MAWILLTSRFITAGVALTRRELQKSLQELEYARYVEPELQGVNTLLGTVLLRLGRVDDAEDAFRVASQQNPDDARAREGLAAILLKHGEYEDAADWALRAGARHSPISGTLSFRRGVCALNRPEEALAALETAVRADSNRIAPYYWLSRISAEQLNDLVRSEQYRDLAQDYPPTTRTPPATIAILASAFPPRSPQQGC